MKNIEIVTKFYKKEAMILFVFQSLIMVMCIVLIIYISKSFIDLLWGMTIILLFVIWSYFENYKIAIMANIDCRKKDIICTEMILVNIKDEFSMSLKYGHLVTKLSKDKNVYRYYLSCREIDTNKKVFLKLLMTNDNFCTFRDLLIKDEPLRLKFSYLENSKILIGINYDSIGLQKLDRIDRIYVENFTNKYVSDLNRA